MNGIIQIDILQYDFMVRALIAGVMVGVAAPMMGMFLVVRRYSLIADTLAHVSLVGVAVGVIAGVSPLGAATAACVLAGAGIERLRTKTNILGETLLAVFLSGSLATAVVLLSLGGGSNVSFLSFLFGSITTVSWGDLGLMGVLASWVVITISWLYPRWFLLAYDENLAKVNGLPVDALNLGMAVLAALTVAIATRVVGALLIGALMVMPVLAATQFKQGFLRSLKLAMGFSQAAIISGLIIAFYANLPAGGAIVLVAIIILALAILLNR